jgi:hypothetical protein
MKTDETHRQFRSVCHIAASQLESFGYTVLKTATRSLTFDLIAFNNERTLFISTRRGKGQQTVKQILHSNKALIADMQNTEVPNYTEKQLWVYQNNHFAIYKLFGNGVIKTQVAE